MVQAQHSECKIVSAPGPPKRFFLVLVHVLEELSSALALALSICPRHVLELFIWPCELVMLVSVIFPSLQWLVNCVTYLLITFSGLELVLGLERLSSASSSTSKICPRLTLLQNSTQ